MSGRIRGRRTAGLLGTGVVLAALGLTGAPPAAAASITVTTTLDPAPGAAPDGLCSLREAVQAAETDRAVDSCPAGVKRDVIALPATGSDYVVDQGTLAMTSWVTLQGAGVVHGDNVDASPVFTVRLSGRVHLDGLTLTGHSAAIGNHGTVLLSNMVIRDITSHRLDAQRAPALDSDGVAYLADTSILSNHGSLSQLGAIHNGPGGTMQIDRSTVAGNTADSMVEEAPAAVGNEGQLFVQASTFRGNGGAAIDSTNDLDLYRSSVTGNQIGLRNSAHASLSFTPVTGNGRGIISSGALSYSAATVGDSSWTRYPGAGGIDSTGTLQVSDAAVVRNTGVGAGGVRSTGTATLTNVTIAGNTATGFVNMSSDQSGNPDGAGGLAVAGGTTGLTNVTVAGNRYTADPALLPPVRAAGNLAALGGSTTLADSVLAGGSLSPAAAGGPDCAGLVISAGYDLVAQPARCRVRTATGDILGADPLLLALADNGGRPSTPTLLPAAGSPLIDHGSPAPAGSPGACLAHDQRSRPRPVDGDGDGVARCDIGAVERQPGAQP